MKKHLGTLLMALVFVVTSAIGAMAGDNAIMASLDSDGVIMQKMDDAALNEVRGTGFAYGLPMPSCNYGITEHHATWLKFGSTADYRSYNYIGSGTTPNAYISATYNGQTQYMLGDVWMVDLTSNPNSWNRAYASVMEYHLQAIDGYYQDANGNITSYVFSGLGYTDKGWNRPMTTFIW